MSDPIDFWFDFSSPYGYLMSERIDDLAARFGRKVRWHPILLGVIFKAHGGAPLTLQHPAKAAYALLDFERSARFMGVPYRHPTKFPLPTQNAAAPTTGCTARIARWRGALPTPSIARCSWTTATFPRRRPCWNLPRIWGSTATGWKQR